MKDNTHNLTNSTRYIAIIPNAWGKGHTAKEAIRQAKKAIGTSKPRYTVVYSYPSAYDRGVYIDNMGYLYGEGLVKVQDNRTVIIERIK